MSRAKIIARLVAAGHEDLAEQLVEGAPSATIDNRYLTSLILDHKRLEEAVEQAKSSSFKAIYLFTHVAAALKDIGKEQGKEVGAGALKLAADIEKGVKALRAADRKLPSDMHLRSALKTTSQDLAKKDQAKDLKRQFQAFLNDFVVKYVDESYENYLKMGGRKEPCVTAAYIKGDMDQSSLTRVWGFPDGFAAEWEIMSAKEKLSMLSNALTTAVRKGKLGRSSGMSGGREAYCYEPSEKNLAKLQQRYGK